MVKYDIVFALWSLQSWKTIHSGSAHLSVWYKSIIWGICFPRCSVFVRINVCEAVKTFPLDWWLKSEPSLKILDLKKKKRRKTQWKGTNSSLLTCLTSPCWTHTHCFKNTHHELLLTFQDGGFSAVLQKKWAKDEKKTRLLMMFSPVCDATVCIFVPVLDGKASRLRSASTVTNCSSLASFPTLVILTTRRRWSSAAAASSANEIQFDLTSERFHLQKNSQTEPFMYLCEGKFVIYLNNSHF